MLAEQFCSSGDMTTLAPSWETVQHYFSRNTAVQGLQMGDEIMLVRFDVTMC